MGALSSARCKAGLEWWSLCPWRVFQAPPSCGLCISALVAPAAGAFAESSHARPLPPHTASTPLRRRTRPAAADGRRLLCRARRPAAACGPRRTGGRSPRTCRKGRTTLPQYTGLAPGPAEAAGPPPAPAPAGWRARPAAPRGSPHLGPSYPCAPGLLEARPPPPSPRGPTSSAASRLSASARPRAGWPGRRARPRGRSRPRGCGGRRPRGAP
mmetsp:Transcript_125704/g.367258  ORF Transcript_125704/g.367258 Transcript_125704/m.367258 type:complete len:213 (+) Transcript_125704:1417-2055(+)